jgi:hypothetical protein
MSVSLLVDMKDEKENAMVHVAGEASFGKYWVPAAKQRSLRWVPQFQDGAFFSVNDLPAVIAEFRVLRMAFEKTEKTKDLVERVDAILELLTKIDVSQVVTMWCG